MRWWYIHFVVKLKKRVSFYFSHKIQISLLCNENLININLIINLIQYILLNCFKKYLIFRTSRVHISRLDSSKSFTSPRTIPTGRCASYRDELKKEEKKLFILFVFLLTVYYIQCFRKKSKFRSTNA